jgi:hypothetical protein
MDEVTMRRYLNAGQDFVRSAAYAPFTQECFARQVVEMLAQ